MSYFTDWTVSIIFVAAACGFFETAAPSGSMRKFVSYVFSIIFLSVLLAPIELLG